jgi:hypothetical protein
MSKKLTPEFLDNSLSHDFQKAINNKVDMVLTKGTFLEHSVSPDLNAMVDLMI